MLTEAFFEEFWKPALVLLCAALLWVFVRIEDAHIAHLNAVVAQQKTALDNLNKELADQNAAVLKEHAAGVQLQAQLDAAAIREQNNAGKVEIQWKTKYLPVPVPADCSAAVAAVASNAASVARIFAQSPSSTP